MLYTDEPQKHALSAEFQYGKMEIVPDMDKDTTVSLMPLNSTHKNG